MCFFSNILKYSWLCFLPVSVCVFTYSQITYIHTYILSERHEWNFLWQSLILGFTEHLSSKILKLLPFPVFPRCQCVYTHQAGRTPTLQQNWQSSEKSPNLRKNTIFHENAVSILIIHTFKIRLKSPSNSNLSVRLSNLTFLAWFFPYSEGNV